MIGSSAGRAAFLIAPPAGGKGTQARRLEADGFFRVEMSAVLGNIPRVAHVIGGSSLVESGVVIEALKDHLEPVPQGQDIVIDGFPRTQAQAEFAVSYFGERHVVFIIIDVDDDTCRQRRATRFAEDLRKHREENGPAPRTDDTEKKHGERLVIYRREMIDLEAYLMRHVSTKVHRVPGHLSPDHVEQVIQKDIFGLHV